MRQLMTMAMLPLSRRALEEPGWISRVPQSGGSCSARRPNRTTLVRSPAGVGPTAAIHTLGCTSRRHASRESLKRRWPLPRRGGRFVAPARV